MAKLNKLMFREYDIRGLEQEDQLNVQSVTLIAQAYGTFLCARGVDLAVVGHDNRQTSAEFYRAATAALQSTGVNVIGLGLCLTPMLYWAQYNFKSQGGLMITASHNPAGWNGLKLAFGYSNTLVSELKEIYELAASFPPSPRRGEGLPARPGGGREGVRAGTLREESIADAYMADLLGRAKLHRPLKVLLNTANATSSFFSPKLLRKFGCEVIEHNTNPDPTYPHYPPNPANLEMMQDTGNQVVAHGADVGVAIDADGDRLGICDEKGETIWPDRYLILLSRLVLAKKPGAKIVFDVKVSEALPEDIRAHGGIPIMCKTGHSYLKKKLREEQAVLAGEQSGHIFFVEDFYGFDDANFAALKLLEYVSAQNEPLSEIVKKTPYYVSTPAYHAATSDEIKYEIVEQLTQDFKAEGYRVVDINGARVYFENGGWGLVRASSNLPALVLRFEAKTKKDLADIEDLFRKKLEKFPEVAKDWESA